MERNEKRFAVLIDADNVSPKYMKYILDEVSDQGVATYKRIYGDWTDTTKRGWKDVLLEWSVNPMQQYGYTSGKNATDSAMIIDAMDILYSNHVEGFCIVSSDSDFTKLAQRLRESGMFVMGMGESKTPRPFRTACDVFKILDVIAQEENANEEDTEEENTNKEEKSEIENVMVKEKFTNIEDIKKSIIKLITEESNKDKGATMSEIGNKLNKSYSDFDVRNYGYSKLSTFLESFEDFKIMKKENSVYVFNAQKIVAKEQVELYVKKLIQSSGGKINNMNLIHEKLNKKYPGFSVKQYGFSRYSSFIRSFNCFVVENNTVRLK